MVKIIIEEMFDMQFVSGLFVYTHLSMHGYVFSRAVKINQPLLSLLPNQPRNPSLHPNQGPTRPSMKTIDRL